MAKIPSTSVITALRPNPKKRGSEAWFRFSILRVGMTVGEAMEQGVWYGDIRGGTERGFITLDEQKKDLSVGLASYNRGSSWCGPNAFSLLTGVCAKEAEALVKMNEKGSSDYKDIIAALKEHGVTLINMGPDYRKDRLGPWIRRQADGKYIARITNHFVVLIKRGKEIVVADNMYPQGVLLTDYSWGGHLSSRSKITHAHRVEA